MGQKKRNRWKDEKTCQWCFLSMDRFQMYFCSEFCETEAKRWKEKQDGLEKSQKHSKTDLQRHNAELHGDDPDDYPFEDGNLS